MDNEDDARYNQAVANILRAKREALDVSFDELAAVAGVSRATVSRMLYGQRDIKVVVLRRLSAALELDPAEVLARATASL